MDVFLHLKHPPPPPPLTTCILLSFKREILQSLSVFHDDKAVQRSVWFLSLAVKSYVCCLHKNNVVTRTVRTLQHISEIHYPSWQDRSILQNPYLELYLFHFQGAGNQRSSENHSDSSFNHSTKSRHSHYLPCSTALVIRGWQRHVHCWRWGRRGNYYVTFGLHVQFSDLRSMQSDC